MIWRLRSPQGTEKLIPPKSEKSSVWKLIERPSDISRQVDETLPVLLGMSESPSEPNIMDESLPFFQTCHSVTAARTKDALSINLVRMCQWTGPMKEQQLGHLEEESLGSSWEHVRVTMFPDVPRGTENNLNVNSMVNWEIPCCL